MAKTKAELSELVVVGALIVLYHCGTWKWNLAISCH